MGIKSGLNSVNRIYVGNVPVSEVYHGVNLVFSLDRGDLSLWRYSNDAIQGKTLLYEYLGGGRRRVQFLYNYNSTNNNYYGYLKNSQPTNGDYIYWGDGGVNFYNNGYKIYNVTASTFQWNWLGTVMTMNSYTTGGFNVNVIEGYPDPLYVPKANGKAIINDWYNSTSSGTTDTNRNTPFYNNPSVVDVDLQGVPFRNNSMYYTFSNCQNLVAVNNIPNSVTNMGYTFYDCSEFNQNIQIPNSVTNMYYTFYRCSSLNQNIQIPNSVTRMQGAFSTSPFNQNIKIPNSVTTISRMFYDCSKFNKNIQIPNSVTDMYATFSGCWNLNQSIQIPNSVVSVHSTFSACYNLNQNIQIGNSVTNMYDTFYKCSNLNSWINILSTNVTNAIECFNTNNANSIPNVMIPARYINNAATATQLAIKNAGWKVSCVGDIVGTSPNRIKSWDAIKGNYNTFKGNGTYWELHKWNGALATALNNGLTVTDVVVPEYFTTYDTFPTALNYPCFRGNTVITSVDFGCDIPWVGNKMGSAIKKSEDTYMNGAFEGCTSLVSIKGVVNPNVTSLLDSFTDSYSIKDVDVVFPEGATNGRGVYYNCINITNHSPLPSTITSMYDYFGRSGLVTGKLANSMVIPPAVTNMSRVFANRQENVGNIYVLSPTVSNIDNVWAKYPTTFKKPFYIYYKYSNNANTATYGLFKKESVFYDTSGNGAGVNPMYNSTSNFYVYDLSSIYNNLWNHTIYLTPAQKLVKLVKYKGSDEHVALMTNYPDLKPHIFDVNCFNNCRYMKTLALYDANIYAFAGSCINMFRNCYNLRVIQGLRLDKVVGSTVGDTNVNLPYSFENCYNLRVMSNIPSNVKSMYYTFRNCYNFDFNVQIKEGVTSMVGTFSGCNSLNKNIKIPNTVTNIADIFYGCSNLSQDIQIPVNVTNMRNAFYSCSNLWANIRILSANVADATDCFKGSYEWKEISIPYRYDNGAYTKTFNSFMRAGYLYADGFPTGKNYTNFYDSSY